MCPKYPAAFYNQGVVHSEGGRPDAAIASYRRAVELQPTYAEAWCNLGVILRSQVSGACTPSLLCLCSPWPALAWPGRIYATNRFEEVYIVSQEDDHGLL